MIRYDKIKSSLFGGVGWRQPTISEYAIIDVDNLGSVSGLFFQDASSFVTIQNLKDSQQDKDISDSNFNAYIKSLQESVIIEACNKIVNDKSDFIRTINLFPYEKAFKNPIAKRGKFVGFTFEQRKKVDKVAKISWAEFAFNEDVTFNLYLYNSNKKDPIKTQSVDAKAFESVIVDLNDWFIADDTTHKGGNFYVGYFEDDLGTAQALDKDYDMGNFQVSVCDYYVRPISLDHSGGVIDVETIINESDSFGLNIGIDIYNDYTEVIVRNKNLFWNAIQWQMSEKVLNILATSIRSNRNTRINAGNLDNILFDLYGNAQTGIKGVVGKLEDAIKDIRQTLFREPRIKRRTYKS
jgi:hypothetical protein